MYGFGTGPFSNASKDLVEKSREAIKFEDANYQAFFQKAMKKFGVDSLADLKGADKKRFYDYVDANWKADKETD